MNHFFTPFSPPTSSHLPSEMISLSISAPSDLKQPTSSFLPRSSSSAALPEDRADAARQNSQNVTMFSYSGSAAAVALFHFGVPFCPSQPSMETHCCHFSSVILSFTLRDFKQHLISTVWISVPSVLKFSSGIFPWPGFLTLPLLTKSCPGPCMFILLLAFSGPFVSTRLLYQRSQAKNPS